MSSSYSQDESEDEFESADEGESVESETIIQSVAPPAPQRNPTPPVPQRNPTPPPLPVDPVRPKTPDPAPVAPLITAQSQPVTSTAVMDGWGDWNIDDETIIEETGKGQKIKSPTPQGSVSSLSSSPSKTGDSASASQIASDEDEQSITTTSQQRSHKKKFRKKQIEPQITKDEDRHNARTSRPSEQCDDEDTSTTVASSTETAKHNVKEAHDLLDRLAAQTPTRAPTWHNPWSNFGSFLSTAKQSVTTLTSTVSEGFNAVIESVEAGLGAPDPQQLAEMNRMAFKIKGETSDSEDEPEVSATSNETDSATNQDGWLNALSLDKLTTTGMKVVSGSLDVLETVGKKTFDVINEADPDMKGARRLLSKQKQPTLSEIIREAQNENSTQPSVAKTEMATFFQLFEKHQGMAHFEALELLSNQSSLVLQTMSLGNENALQQIDTYFQFKDDEAMIDTHLESLNISDENDQQHIPTLDVLSTKFTAYQTQLRSTVSVDKILEVYETANQFLKEWDWMDTELDQKTLADEAIDSLAILCARIIEYYRKTGELFLMGCKSLTSFSIDVELLAIYQKQQEDFSSMLAGIPHLFAKSMKQISSLPSAQTASTDMPIRCDPKYKQKLLNQMFIQSSSSQTYASDAYSLLKPIISQSILYHTSTTR